MLILKIQGQSKQGGSQLLLFQLKNHSFQPLFVYNTRQDEGIEKNLP